MSTITNRYCLDANVLIQAWQKYYNPNFCPDYWNVLNELGKDGKIFIPQMVYVLEEDEASGENFNSLQVQLIVSVKQPYAGLIASFQFLTGAIDRTGAPKSYQQSIY